MKISEVKNVVKEIVTATGIVPALVGERGIGKTEVLKQLASDLGWGYHAIYPSALEGPDFMGLVVKDLEAGVTRYLAPEFLPTEKAVEKGLFPENGLLVLEEFNRAEVQTIHVLFPLLQEGRINVHKIHPGWKMVVAMNPDTSAYTTASLDLAALDRILTLQVDAQVDDYIDYCVSTGRYDRDILEYLAVYPNMLCDNSAEDSSGKSPSPRSWSKVQELRMATTFGDSDSSMALEVLAGAVGTRAIASFFGYLRDRETMPISAEEIIRSTEKSIEKLKIILDKGRFDVLNVTLRELAAKLPDIEPIGSIEKFLLVLPEEGQAMFCKILYQRNREEFAAILREWPTYSKKVYSKISEILGGNLRNAA